MYRRISKFVLIVSLTTVTLIGFSSWRKSTQAKSDRPLGASVANRASNKPPNIVLLIADDMGYSDLKMYGGEISTPNIDALAKSGMMFTNFHALPVCSPTRAVVLSGVDNHLSGLGNMGEHLASNQKGKPGYEGYLNDRVVTLPTLLKDAGYHTYMAGKWHLGSKQGYLPSDRGFEQSFGLTGGAASHYSDEIGYTPERPKANYTSNGKVVHLPKDFYSTEFYTNKLMEFINRDRNDSNPFFVYAAYTSPHDPLQAPQDDIQKYQGKYDRGWDRLRKERFDRMKKLSLIPPHLELPPRLPRVPAWDGLTSEQQRYEAKKMAIYAAMVENLDYNIGRLLDYLKKIGEYDNTIFVFFSDNGAEGSSRAQSQPYQAWFKQIGINNSYENIGKVNSFVEVGRSWAQVQATPYQWYKGRVSEGGIRVPAIVSYKGAIKANARSDAFGSVRDLMPTLLEYAGVKHPGTRYQGRAIFPTEGRSLRPVLEGKRSQIYGENDPVAFELFGNGNSALFMGDWKIMKLNPPWGDGQWKLFNLRQDPEELNDLSKQYPERLAKMIPLYEQYEKEKGVIPTSEASYDALDIDGN